MMNSERTAIPLAPVMHRPPALDDLLRSQQTVRIGIRHLEADAEGLKRHPHVLRSTEKLLERDGMWWQVSGEPGVPSRAGVPPHKIPARTDAPALAESPEQKDGEEDSDSGDHQKAKLGYNRLHHPARNISEPEIAPLEAVGEPFVIDPQQMKHRCVEVMHGHGVLRDTES